MKTISYKVYNFKELNKEGKEQAIKQWYEHETYDFMQEDLTETCKELLEKNKVKYEGNLKVYYSLSYSQGDRLCFVGSFQWKKHHIEIKHSARYYYAKSTDIAIMNEEGEEINNSEVIEQFTNIYLDICDKLEKEGYSIIEYRMNDKEFNELCEANEYTFTDKGVMDNSN